MWDARSVLQGCRWPVMGTAAMALHSMLRWLTLCQRALAPAWVWRQHTLPAPGPGHEITLCFMLGEQPALQAGMKEQPPTQTVLYQVWLGPDAG